MLKKKFFSFRYNKKTIKKKMKIILIQTILLVIILKQAAVTDADPIINSGI